MFVYFVRNSVAVLSYSTKVVCLQAWPFVLAWMGAHHHEGHKYWLLMLALHRQQAALRGFAHVVKSAFFAVAAIRLGLCVHALPRPA